MICVHRRVNPVEHIYAAFPMFLYLNASIAGSLLLPLLEVQDGPTGQPFAAADIGTVYPVANSSHAVLSQGVERECPFASAHVTEGVMIGALFEFLQSPGTCLLWSWHTRGYRVMGCCSPNMCVRTSAIDTLCSH